MINSLLLLWILIYLIELLKSLVILQTILWMKIKLPFDYHQQF